ncbi:NAD-dependent epimerase/dehydratase family protein [Erwinia rhapontici]|uniref:polysaccharide biosynthesis C-terminal domain-containing protein n=1 Tax=Erwinia rhapontici TaxID=55212 RepID=UPI003B9F63C8
MAKVLITGANGFIGKNLKFVLTETGHEVHTFSHSESIEALEKKVIDSEYIFHLAGVNRPDNDEEFFSGNVELTESIINIIKKNRLSPVIIYSSSAQATFDNPYGRSKRQAEDRLLSALPAENVIIYRLPGVFGKWCRPNYNSVVATFCHNVVNNIELQVNAPDKLIDLVYIDDVMADFSQLLNGDKKYSGFQEISVSYKLTLAELSTIITGFRESRTSLMTDSVGTGLERALYATYLSYLKPNQFSYNVPVYSDARGDFSELLKTPDHGQFSYFTAKPGVVRGGHYHHTKNEKFIVVAGTALFCFEHIDSGEKYEITVSSENTQIVETIPGWAHNIKNISQENLIVLLWANEIFDREHPDTIYWSM